MSPAVTKSGKGKRYRVQRIQKFTTAMYCGELIEKQIRHDNWDCSESCLICYSGDCPARVRIARLMNSVLLP